MRSVTELSHLDRGRPILLLKIVTLRPFSSMEESFEWSVGDSFLMMWPSRRYWRVLILLPMLMYFFFPVALAARLNTVRFETLEM